MNTDQNIAITKRYLYLLNTFILLVHISLLCFFTLTRVTAMACVNVCSVLCYLICYPLIRRERIPEYILTAFLEILIHAFLAVLCLGFGSYFQFYFIGSISIILFAQYFSVHLRIKLIRGIQWSLFCTALFFISLFIDRYSEPFYQLSERIAFGMVVFNSIVTFSFLILFFGMLTKIASTNEIELARQATHDNLTGLMNRHYMTQYMNELSKIDNLEDYWLAIIDIDDFKAINDRYGHLCGDYVLRTVADILVKRCGDRIVCRWGGEEFLVVSTHPEHDEGILLEDIRRNIEAERFVYDAIKTLRLTVTIGASHHQKGQSLDDWLNLADKRLYEGKQTGKNRIIGVEI